MTLDKKLVRLRKKEGLSQADVSEKLDVSRQAVTKWETGTSRPSTENLQALSKLYNVPLEYLLDESADELPTAALAAPETPVAESGPEREVQKKGRQRIKRLVIGEAAVALVLCRIFWYVNYTNKNNLSLSEIERRHNFTRNVTV